MRSEPMIDITVFIVAFRRDARAVAVVLNRGAECRNTCILGHVDKHNHMRKPAALGVQPQPPTTHLAGLLLHYHSGK